MGNLTTQLCSQEPKIYRPEYTLATHESFVQFEAYKELRDSNSIDFEERVNNKDFAEWYEAPGRSKEDIKLNYNVIKDIGSGFYGNVTKAYLKREKLIAQHPNTFLSGGGRSRTSSTKKRIFAIKNIKKKKHKDRLDMFMREIEFMKALDHPNVIRFYEVFEDEDEIHLVMEYCKGGDLNGLLKRKRKFSEGECHALLLQILRSVAHLHSKNICHRDLKPENFLLKKKNGLNLRLIDFGLSTFCKDGRMKDTVGTPYFMAPEVVQGVYSQKCDIWSIGVIFYSLATGKLPFDGKDKPDLFQKIKKLKFSMSLLKEMGLSRKARGLIRGMIAPEKERYTATEALNHGFFHQKIYKKIPVSDLTSFKNNLSHFLSFKTSSILQREIINLMIKIFIDSRKIKKLTKMFNAFDTSHTGVLKQSNLKDILNKFSIKIEDKELESKINSIYLTTKSSISYSEFIAAMLPPDFYTNEVRLRITFNYLDTDQNGLLNIQDLETSFRRFGRNLDRQKVKVMMQGTGNFRENGKIFYQEFKDFMVIGEQVRPERVRKKGKSGYTSTDYC